MTRYHTIVADPPWDHSDGTGLAMDIGFGATRRARHGGIETRRPPYPAMTTDAICELPVGDLAERDAHLYLWTTNRYLHESFTVISAWRFTHSSTLVWCKKPTGFRLGGAFPSTVEFCHFCRRGNLPTIGTADSRWFTWPRRRGPSVREGQHRNTKHSAKPEAFLDLVEQISPGPYLELFARRNRLGWDTWGNEAHEHVSLEASS